MSFRVITLALLSLILLTLWHRDHLSSLIAKLYKDDNFLSFDTYWDSIVSNTKTNSPKNSTTTLTVMTYNIRHCNPPSNGTFIDVDAIASVINSVAPDLVAVQEVDVNTTRDGNISEAQELASKTGMNYFFAKTIDFEGGEYGILILSKYPILSAQKYPLPTAEGSDGEPRALATAEVLLPDNSTIVFACTHLDVQKNDTTRLMQIATILDILKNVTVPVIIGGDFNSTPDSEVIKELDTEFTRTCTKLAILCGFTIPSNFPVRTIDYLAYKPANMFTVEKHAVVHGDDAKYASDHLPVEAVLTLNQ